ncbi:g5305 [Coccomyxa elongata]
MAGHVRELVKLAVAAEPPTTPLQQALLPRMQPALEASKPYGCFKQRIRVAKVAVNGANYSGLLAKKAALERELVTLLNRHERLSRGLPWHMQHEEVSFMASIARCIAAGQPCTLPTSAQAVPNAYENMFKNLMLAPCATMNDVYQAAGIGLAFPAGCKQPLQSEDLDVFPRKAGRRSPVWSSIVTFLKLSKLQKDKLAAAYDAHVQRAAAMRRECLAIGTKLQISPQAESVLNLNLAKHLACGHLTGIAKENKDLVRILNNECYEVLTQVQLNNLLALAPPRPATALGLCCEVAALRAAVTTAEVGTPLYSISLTNKNVTRPVDASPPLPAGTKNAAGDVDNAAVVTAAATLVTASGGAARAPRKASAQAARTKQVPGAHYQLGTLDQLMAAGAPPSRRRKRQMAESFSDSEGRPASKVQSTAAMLCSPQSSPLPTQQSNRIP